jgi:hypothetical protein
MLSHRWAVVWLLGCSGQPTEEVVSAPAPASDAVESETPRELPTPEPMPLEELLTAALRASGDDRDISSYSKETPLVIDGVEFYTVTMPVRDSAGVGCATRGTDAWCGKWLIGGLSSQLELVENPERFTNRQWVALVSFGLGLRPISSESELDWAEDLTQDVRAQIERPKVWRGPTAVGITLVHEVWFRPGTHKELHKSVVGVALDGTVSQQEEVFQNKPTAIDLMRNR